MTITSHPAGSKQCHACLTSTSPTLSVNDGYGTMIACDDCRQHYEAKGATSARAIEQAISDAMADGPGKVKRRDAVIRLWRHRIDQKSRDTKGNKMLMDIGLEEAREAKRRARRKAA